MRPKQNSRQKDILFIFISSFIVVVAWISFNIYHIWATSTLNPDVQSELTPIIPVFDPQVINQLKTRESIQPLFQSQQTPSTLSPTPPLLSSTPTPTSLLSSPQTASNASQLAPTNSPINRLGQ